MIAEATRNARTAVTQFAADSESLIGDIRRANQGLFQILPRNNAPGVLEQNQIQKTLRVVSTMVPVGAVAYSRTRGTAASKRCV